MKISCGAVCIKYLLFIFNILWMIFAIVLLVLGFKCIDWSGDIEQIYSNSVRTGAGLVVAVGFVILLMAFIGCCGAITQSSCLLSTYAAIISVLLIVEVVGAVLIFIYKNEVERELKGALSREFEKWNGNHGSGGAQAIQALQLKFQCCGVDDYRTEFTGWDAPAACCDQWSVGDPAEKTCLKSMVVFTTGCADKIVTSIRNYLGALVGVAIAMLVLQLLLIVCAGCLAREV